MGIETAYAKLLGCIATNDVDGTQQAIFDLGSIHSEYDQVPDNLVERLLTILRNDRMYKSPLDGHILSFFEFESPRLTPHQKSLCIGFINAHGDEFMHIHSQQMIAELREGNYLK